jgi:peptidoglycan/LPS O-acetylase OafA/YrhL
MTSPLSSPNPVPNPPRLRLEVLDSVRGLAALVVVFFHVKNVVQPVTDTLSKPFRLLASINNHGHDAVVVFIVLSGFVLTLPVARAGKLEIPGGLAEYFRRRARRILPPYFAALAIFLLLGSLWFLATPLLQAHGFAARPNPIISADATVWGYLAHLFMIYNVKRSWALTVDSPMWSVATEWQIYFLFPFILLPLWRRAGLAAAIVGGFAVGLIPVFLLPRDTDFDTWCPWLLGDFAMGMAAAAIAIAPARGSGAPARFARIGIWGVAFIACVLVIGGLQGGLPRIWHKMSEWQHDALTGIAVGLLLVYLARCQLSSTKPSLAFRVLDTRWPIFLGAFSYSLYLVHYPLVCTLDVFVGRFIRSGVAHVIAMYGLGTILSLLAGYGFHLAFERPFMRSKPRSN